MRFFFYTYFPSEVLTLGLRPLDLPITGAQRAADMSETLPTPFSQDYECSVRALQMALRCQNLIFRLL
uniref:Uncharacterized protein n=1 Tax=Timema douglasi TaxID=61478 RepID=A0A7R8ZBS3_TIMDO|nr:unnamed protein product [Timema douglasi]